jgi:signal peptidase I
MSVATQTPGPEPLLAGRSSFPRARTKNSRVRSLCRQLLEVVAVASLAAASYFVISHFLLQSVKVVGRSMVPTLHDSQHYLLNRWVYHFRAPKPTDVVVVRDPSDNGFSVKRIIAMPGDSVYLKEGKVYVNGCKLHEAYLSPGTLTFIDAKAQDELVLCGKDQYFLLGDNRGNSIDSRVYGPVPRANILGPIVH